MLTCAMLAAAHQQQLHSSRRVYPSGGIFGVSVHTEEEVKHAALLCVILTLKTRPASSNGDTRASSGLPGTITTLTFIQNRTSVHGGAEGSVLLGGEVAPPTSVCFQEGFLDFNGGLESAEPSGTLAETRLAALGSGPNAPLHALAAARQHSRQRGERASTSRRSTPSLRTRQRNVDRLQKLPVVAPQGH